MKGKLKNPLQRIHELSIRPMLEKEELPFPRMLDLELTNRCNMQCVMCPTGNGSVKRKKGDMTVELAERVLDEASEHGTPIRFIRWGEPMLSPHFHEIVVETKMRGLICHINTNGKLLDEDTINFIIHTGIESIKFSFQGVTKRGYENFRNSSGFHKLLDKIKRLHHRREELGAETPFIQIGTTITTEPDYLVQQFRMAVDSYTDAVYVGKTQDLQQKTPSNVPYCECPEVFDKLSINYDGSVTACCGDYDNYMIVGNVLEKPLIDIWNDKPLADIRKKLLMYRHNHYFLCSRCARQ